MSTDIADTSLTCWKLRAMPSRAIASGVRPETRTPENRTSPAESGSIPLIRLNKVLLPAPLGPIRPRISPRPMSKSTLSTATKPPKCRVAPRTDSSVGSAFGARAGTGNAGPAGSGAAG